MGKKQSDQKRKSLEIQRSVNPHRDAMLASLRVVLDLPNKPIVFKDEERNAHE